MRGVVATLLPPSLRERIRLIVSRDPRLRAAPFLYRRRRERHVYGGHALDVVIADPLGKKWHAYDWPEMHEIDHLRRGKLRRGACVFNIGAHQGIVAMVLAKSVGPEGTVVAVEANAHNTEIARRNQVINGLSQLHVVQAAAGEWTGTVEFDRALLGHVRIGTGELGHTRVPMVSVDDLAEKYSPPAVLYVDVEGYECQVLRGARESLSRRPDCFIEVHPTCGLEKYGGSVEQVLAHFPVDDYELFMSREKSHRSADHTDFVPFDHEDPMVQRRFFLIALSRGNRWSDPRK